MLKLWQSGQEKEWLDGFKVKTPFKPRYSEVDIYGHVSNVFYDEYFEMGRLDYFKRVNDPEPAYKLMQFAHVIAEQHIRFMRSCTYDEDLSVATKIAEIGRSSATLEQVILGPDGSMRAIASTTVVRNDGKESMPWTNAQREAIATFEGFLSAGIREF